MMGTRSEANGSICFCYRELGVGRRGLSGCFFGRKLYPSPLRNHRWGLFAGGSVGDCVTARFAFMCTFLLRFDALTS